MKQCHCKFCEDYAVHAEIRHRAKEQEHRWHQDHAMVDFEHCGNLACKLARDVMLLENELLHEPEEKVLKEDIGKEYCEHCKQPRPARNISSPTKAYTSFENYIKTFKSYTTVQLKDAKLNAIDVLQKAYNDGKDLDNDFIDDAILCHALEVMSLLRYMKEHAEVPE